MVPPQVVRGDGFFAADSVTRKIYSSTAVLLGWPRAICMQLAHPLIAAGVAEHSGYRTAPLERFLQTFDTALQIIFGTMQQAEIAANKINVIHQRVRGELPETVGGWAAGTPYRASDPALLLWVHCTVVESDVLAYEKFVGPLSQTEKEACFRERAAAAPLLGLSPGQIPGSFSEMTDYLQAEIDSDRIAVADFQRELVHHLLYPAIKLIPKKSYEPLVGVTVDLLPEKLRLEYRLEMTRARRAGSKLIGAFGRRGLPWMPAVIKSFPVARARSILLPG